MPLDIDLDPDEVKILRGALLAAKATELAEIQRRDLRQFAGYGSDAARTAMTSEVEHHRRRIELLDRLIEALSRSG